MIKFKQRTVGIKAGPDDGLKEGEFLVYPSTFTRTPDSYGDVVAQGAFAKSLAKWKDSGLVMPGLFGHRMDDPDFYVAEAHDMGEDDHGWWVKGAFDMESPKGPQVYRLVKGKRLNELSFAYEVMDEGQIELEDGVKANELREVDAWEFSFVPKGANSDTSVVDIKSAPDLLRTLMASGRIIDLKAGRVLARKHVDSLREAYNAIGEVIKAADADAEAEANGEPKPNEEEPPAANSEEAAKSRTARAGMLARVTAAL